MVLSRNGFHKWDADRGWAEIFYNDFVGLAAELAELDHPVEVSAIDFVRLFG